MPPRHVRSRLESIPSKPRGRHSESDATKACEESNRVHKQKTTWEVVREKAYQGLWGVESSPQTKDHLGGCQRESFPRLVRSRIESTNKRPLGRLRERKLTKACEESNRVHKQKTTWEVVREKAYQGLWGVESSPQTKDHLGGTWWEAFDTCDSLDWTCWNSFGICIILFNFS